MKQTVALVLSVILGFIAVLAMKNYIEQEKKTAASRFVPVKVIVAAKAIPLEAQLSSGDCRGIEIPEDSATADMIQPSEIGTYMGRPLGRALDRGAFLMKSDFKRPEAKIASAIPSGKRLIAVSVDQIAGVAGLIQPGGRVDVLYTQLEKVGAASDKRGARTVHLLSDVIVHAVDNRTNMFIGGRTDSGSKPYNSVTLLVSPLEAVIITAAQQTGKVTLALRSPDDVLATDPIPAIGAENLESTANLAERVRMLRMKKE